MKKHKTNSAISVAHEKELNMLFGDNTQAKKELHQLRQVALESESNESLRNDIKENTATIAKAQDNLEDLSYSSMSEHSNKYHTPKRMWKKLMRRFS